jgi:hypothetical protein
MASPKGFVLRFVLVVAARDRRRQVQFLCDAVECRRE